MRVRLLVGATPTSGTSRCLSPDISAPFADYWTAERLGLRRASSSGRKRGNALRDPRQLLARSGYGDSELYARIRARQRVSAPAAVGQLDRNRAADLHVRRRRHREPDRHPGAVRVPAGEEVLRLLLAGARPGGDGPAGHLHGQPVHHRQLPGPPGAAGPQSLRVRLLPAAVLRPDRTQHHRRHGGGAVPGHLPALPVPALGGEPPLGAEVPALHLHQPHLVLLPPHDGGVQERTAAVRHLVLHRLEDLRAPGRHLLRAVRGREPDVDPRNHRAEPGGVRDAAADAPQNRAPARNQSQRQAAVEGAVVGRGDADDDGAGDDVRGGSGLFGPVSDPYFRQPFPERPDGGPAGDPDRLPESHPGSLDLHPAAALPVPPPAQPDRALRQPRQRLPAAAVPRHHQGGPRVRSADVQRQHHHTAARLRPVPGVQLGLPEPDLKFTDAVCCREAERNCTNPHGNRTNRYYLLAKT